MDATALVPHRTNGLWPIGAASIPDALALLQRGFPERNVAFWEAGLAEIGQLHARFGEAAAPVGYLLRFAEQNVGVLLSCRSLRRRPDGSLYPVINLSSWYVDPQYRLLAPFMLRQAVARSEGCYTDLTPSHGVARINTQLGFRLWNDGMMIVPSLPWSAIPGGSGKVTSCEAGLPPALEPEDRDLLAWHAERGLLAAVLHDGDRLHPLLFRRIRRKGLTFAHLIYAESRSVVTRNLAPIMRYLLRNGLGLLCIDAIRSDCPLGTVFWQTRKSFLKGDIERDRIDYAYSELVLLGV